MHFPSGLSSLLARLQALARVSAVDSRSGDVIIDDYVLPSENILDYKTRFSGLTPEDLDPLTSPHHLVTWWR